VIDCTKERLEEINKVSRQLLSRILAAHSDSKMHYQELDIEKNDDLLAEKKNNEITELMKKRHTLITQLFKQSTADNMSAEPKLIEEMITLDDQLTANANLYKQAITEQVIKIKKSKKVTKSYQKY
jgi:hypothetical protein